VSSIYRVHTRPRCVFLYVCDAWYTIAMKQKIVIANWKMNPISQFEAKKIALASDKKGVIICPPFVFLSQLREIIKNAELGAQNAFWEDSGAFTGEISIEMLKKIGCRYIIIGHSERRELFFENDQLINKKVLSVLSKKIKVILCVGERKEDFDRWKIIIKDQIRKGLVGISKNDFSNIIIAYEPIWAIGTGKACDFKRAEAVCIFINNFLKEYFYTNKVKILYGGSVDAVNYFDYIEKSGFNGLLVGGISLRTKEFLKIINKI